MTYGSTLTRNWVALAGLMLGLAGCSGGDDGDTGATTFNTPTSTAGSTTDEPGTTTDATGTGTPTTTMPPADSSGGESSGGVTCDPPCAAGEQCIGGTCFDAGDSSSGEPPPPTSSDYGPCDMCAAGEVPVMVGTIEGCFCSPGCDGQGSACPDPNEGSAQAMCVLELMMGAGPTNCALICDLAANNCPPGATCEDAGGAGVCVHPS